MIIIFKLYMRIHFFIIIMKVYILSYLIVLYQCLLHLDFSILKTLTSSKS